MSAMTEREKLRETVATWRCFQCDEVFTDSQAAAEHFGLLPHYPPGCVARLTSTDKELVARAVRADANGHRLYLQKTALEKALAEARGTEAVNAAYAAAEAEFATQPAAALSTLPATGGEVVEVLKEAVFQLDSMVCASDGGHAVYPRPENVADKLRALADRLSASPPPSHNSDDKGG